MQALKVLLFTRLFIEGWDKLNNMLQMPFYYNILEAAMIAQSQHDRLTLQEYMQTYNIKKKIQQRKKSKQKNQSPFILSEQQAKMKSIFTMIDQLNEQTKIELEDILLNTQNRSERIFFYLAKTLDQLIMKVKVHITKMYEDVYRYIQVQNSQTGQNKSKEDVANYLKNKIVVAKDQKKKSNMGEVVKENFKNQDKNAFLAKLIMGKTMDSSEEPKQHNIKQASSVNKSPPKATVNRLKSAEPQRIKQDIITKKVQQTAPKRQPLKNPQVPVVKKQKPPVVVQKKQALPPLPPMPPQPPKQPRMNSFMQALFGAFQKSPQKEQVENQPPIESEIDENKKKQVQKQSKLSTNRQFQRKRSAKEMLKSPKAQILLGRSPYH